MYYQHNLRSNLQEWANRIAISPNLFESNIKFFLDKISNNSLLVSIVEGAISSYPSVTQAVEQVVKNIIAGGYSEFRAKDEKHNGVFEYLLLKTLLESDEFELSIWNLVNSGFCYGSSTEEQVSSFFDDHIKPIVYLFEDSLDEGSFVLHILEKYKFRTEHFTKKGLVQAYKDADSNYEQIFEDDLRLYLFDQGIENPFSTPKSSSGRTDIVGQLDTDDPLVLEIKIYDEEKNYKKDRVLSGFKQAVKYTNDYNKPVGYLVSFVLNDVEIKIKSAQDDKTWPSKVEYNGCQYNLIFINLYSDSTASKGKLNTVEITQEDLENALKD